VWIVVAVCIGVAMCISAEGLFDSGVYIVAVWCSVLSVLQCVAESGVWIIAGWCRVLQCDVVWCRVVQGGAGCCSVLQCVVP